MKLRWSLPSLLGILLLVGCDLNAGDAAQERFEDWYAAHEIDTVTNVDPTGENTLPGAGRLHVKATMRTGVSVADLASAEQEMCAYNEDNEGADAEIEITAGVTSWPVDCEESKATDHAHQLWEATRKTPGVASLTMGPRQRVDLTVTAVPFLVTTRAVQKAMHDIDRDWHLSHANTKGRTLTNDFKQPVDLTATLDVMDAVERYAGDSLERLSGTPGLVVAETSWSAATVAQHRKALAASITEPDPEALVLPAGVHDNGSKTYPPATVLSAADRLSQAPGVTSIDLGSRVDKVSVTGLPAARTITGVPLRRSLQALGEIQMTVELPEPKGICRFGIRDDAADDRVAVILQMCGLAGLQDSTEAKDMFRIRWTASDVAPLVRSLRHFEASKVRLEHGVGDGAARSVFFTVTRDGPDIDGNGDWDKSLIEDLRSAW